MIADTNTTNYLDLFRQTLLSAEAELHRLENLDDVRKCDPTTLRLHFVESGMHYPDFPECTDAIRRTILVNAESVISKRGTRIGLLEYVGYFASIGVSITVGQAVKRVLVLDRSAIGLPNTDMLNSVVDANTPDDCYYLYDPMYGVITICMSASVSDEMKNFFESTIPDEIAFAGTDAPAISLNFVYA